jgi:hypothetical protein
LLAGVFDLALLRFYDPAQSFGPAHAMDLRGRPAAQVVYRSRSPGYLRLGISHEGGQVVLEHPLSGRQRIRAVIATTVGSSVEW